MRGIKSDQAQAEVTGALLGPRGNWNKSQSKKGIQELHQQMLGHGEPPGKARTPLLGLEEGKDGMPGVGGRQCKYPREQRAEFIET